MKASANLGNLLLRLRGVNQSVAALIYEDVRHKKASRGTCNQSGQKGPLVNKAYE